jgi:hypothetical protein
VDEYRLVATLFAEAIAHIRKPAARRIITEQIADFLEEHYPEHFTEDWRA